MTIDPIQAGVAQALNGPQGAASAAPDGRFESLLATGLGKLDQTLKTSDASLQAFAAGADVPVHQVMIDMEKATLTLQLAVQVRNHIVDAYQEFMRMQL